MHSEENPISKKSNKWLLALKILFSVGMLAWVVYKIELWKITETLREVQIYYLFPALICFLVSKVISSVRLNYFFRDIELKISEWENLKLYWIGMLYNTILPGGIGGDGYKTWYLHKYYSINWKRIGKAILLDRVAGLLALCLLAILLGIILFFHYYILLAALILALLITYIIVIYNFFPRFIRSIQPTLILSTLVQLFQLSSAFFILCSLDVNANYLPYFYLFLLSSIATVIPFTIGGAGMREIVFLYCSSWFYIDMYAGVTMVFIFYLISIVGSLPAIYQLFHHDTSVSQPDKI